MVRHLSCLPVLSLLLAACGGPAPEVLLASPPPVMRVGESAVVRAEYRQGGESREGVGFTWRSADEGIAEVDNDGRVYAIAEGVTRVIATAFDVDSEPLTVTVRPRRVEPTLTLSPTSVSLEVGGAAQLLADYTDEDGKPAQAPLLSFTVAPAGVVTVDGSGVLTALAKGQAQVRAAVGEVLSPPVLVTVVGSASEVAEVVVAGPATLVVGQVGTFTAQARNLAGQVVPGKTFVFQSEAPAVAQVDGSGVATAMAVGTTGITASVDGVQSVPLVLEVKDPSSQRTGSFSGSGNYTVTGTATLSAGGSALSLAFGPDFFSSSGPDLEVFLSTTPTVTAESVSLGRLKSTSGAQSYEVSAGVSGLDSHPYVIVECVKFRVRFGWATLN
jgi:uncharacterized protein YjdB